MGDLSEALSPIPIVRRTSANIVVRLVINIFKFRGYFLVSYIPYPVYSSFASDL